MSDEAGNLETKVEEKETVEKEDTPSTPSVDPIVSNAETKLENAKAADKATNASYGEAGTPKSRETLIAQGNLSEANFIAKMKEKDPKKAEEYVKWKRDHPTEDIGEVERISIPWQRQQPVVEPLQPAVQQQPEQRPSLQSISQQLKIVVEQLDAMVANQLQTAAPTLGGRKKKNKKRTMKRKKQKRSKTTKK